MKSVLRALALGLALAAPAAAQEAKLLPFGELTIFEVGHTLTLQQNRASAPPSPLIKRTTANDTLVSDAHGRLAGQKLPAGCANEAELPAFFQGQADGNRPYLIYEMGALAARFPCDGPAGNFEVTLATSVTQAGAVYTFTGAAKAVHRTIEGRSSEINQSFEVEVQGKSCVLRAYRGRRIESLVATTQITELAISSRSHCEISPRR